MSFIYLVKNANNSWLQGYKTITM